MKIELFVIVVFLELCLGRKETLSPEINVCIGRKTCGDCLEAGPKCAFCTSAEYDTRNLPRCDFIGNHNDRCQSSNIVYPTSTLQRTQDTLVRNGVGNTQSAIQVQPQAVNINIRPNDPQRFNLTFRLADKYPIDLYYLMDLSYSMKDDKDNLANQVNDIANALRNITDDVRMGFGSFIDKLTAPFSYTEPDKIDSPCPGCSRPYGYKNELKLDADVSKFLDKVRNAPVSGNIDHDEGGSDAIMQVLSCKDQIGWRADARRLLLVSTDARFHYAGDGKLGGIVQRNDGICHLDATSGLYTESLNQDYPSVGQIAATVKQKDVNLIFAVPGDIYGHYKAISDFILGSEIANVTSNSADMVNLVKAVYRRLTSKVTLLYSEEENLSVKFFSNCNGKRMENTNTCENIQIGESLTFEVEIELKKCPKDPALFTQAIDITPVGITDRVTINLSYMCQCDCEKDSAKVANSPRCSMHGTETCGTCECNDGYFGKTCECSGSSLSNLETCKKSDSEPVCSDRGYCSCGTCECFTRTATSVERYSGQYCQCDDYQCPFSLGKICGGEGHGVCKCGACNCTKDYTGAACDCPTSTASCMAKGNKPGGVCNGHGNCVCGKCQCAENYRGATCEDCPECKEVCKQYRPCVECVVFKSGSFSEEECNSKCMAEGLIEQVTTLEGGFKTCEFKDAEDCRFYFSYSYATDDELNIQVRKKKDCPVPVNVVAIVVPILLTVVIIGIVGIIIYKVVTTIYDKKQLAIFEEQIKASKFSEGNPLFKPATKHYKNPTYGKVEG